MAASTFIQKKIQEEKTTPEHVFSRQNILFGLIALILFGVGIWMRMHKLGLPFDRDGYDEGVYWQSLRAMSGGQALYRQIFYSQPPFFLFSIFPTFLLFGQTLWAARLGIVLVSLAGLVGAFLLGKAVNGRVGAIAALLLLIMSRLYLTESQTLQAEAPSAAFSLLAVGLIYLWWERPDKVTGLWLSGLAAIALALSILSKLLAVSTLVPFGLLLAARCWQILQQTPETRLKSARPLIIAICAFIVTMVLLILPFAGSFQQFWQEVVTFHTDAGTAFQATQSGNRALIQNMLISATSLAALYGTIVALLRRDWRVLPLLAWFLVTAFILWRQTPLFTHHLVALVPPLVGLAIMGIGPVPQISVVALLYGLINRAPTAATPQQELQPISIARRNLFSSSTLFSLISLLLILIASVLGGRDIIQYYHTQQHLSDSVSQQQNRVIKDLQAVTKPDQLVITDAQFIAALANRNTPPSLVDTSAVRIGAHYVTFQQLVQAAEQPQVHAILFYTGRLVQKIPQFHTWVSQHFRLVKRYGNDQELWVSATF